MAKGNLQTCSGSGKALRTSTSKGLKSAAGRTLATKCKTKGTLFEKVKSTKKEGLKADGTLKKGYKYAKGGRIVKAKKK